CRKHQRRISHPTGIRPREYPAVLVECAPGRASPPEIATFYANVPAALSASQLVKSFLFETQANDPGTLALAGVVLLSAAILAGYAPARRASRIDPLVALRHE